MDFITSLPEVNGLSSIMVVVDRFSKYATFIPCKAPCQAEDAAAYFFKHVVKYWGVPLNVISDRDTRFTSKFWTELFRLMGTKLYLSSTHHPQTDGQTERVNGILEEYLRHFVQADQKNWPDLLDAAQFCYNNHKSESSQFSPFELATGRQPLIPLSVGTGYMSFDSDAIEFMRDYQGNLAFAKAQLQKAADRMKKHADAGRRELHFQVGDKVLLRMDPEVFKLGKNMSKSLQRKFDGPYEVMGRVGKAAYRLKLPPHLKTHNVFHVSQLRPHFEDEFDESRNQPNRPPTRVVTDPEGELEEIISMRRVGWGKAQRREFLCSWKDQDGKRRLDTWERPEALWRWPQKVEEFLQKDPLPIDKF